MNTSGSRLSALYIGQRAELTRTFDTAAIKRWCALAAMPQTPSNVPEPLIAGLFSCLLGEQLPGHGTNYLKQHMDFWRAAPIGARLMASVTVTAIRAEKHSSTSIRNASIPAAGCYATDARWFFSTAEARLQGLIGDSRRGPRRVFRRCRARTCRTPLARRHTQILLISPARPLRWNRFRALVLLARIAGLGLSARATRRFHPAQAKDRRFLRFILLYR